MSKRCCKCTSSGDCANCVCAKKGQGCAHCLPKERNGCINQCSDISINQFPASHQLSDAGQPINDGLFYLPTFDSTSKAPFTWGNFNRDEILEQLNEIYAEVIHWRANLFTLPSGKAGSEFIKELARLYRAFAEQTSLEKIALTASFVLQILILQKPFARARAKDCLKCVIRRLGEWKEGKFKALLCEGRVIQKHLPQMKDRSKSHPDREAENFSHMMSRGKIKTAMRLLKSSRSGVLNLDTQFDGKSVLEILRNKHPVPAPIHNDILLEIPDDALLNNAALFEKIDGPLIRQVSLATHGSAGPSGVDDRGWHRFCGHFDASVDLCDAIAAVARRIATKFVDPDNIQTLINCRLIPLNKNPGVRPIGIGEVIRRIIGKAILKVAGPDIKVAAGPLQLCAGHESGAEAGIHAMNEILEDNQVEGALLIDANNAFNSLNRKAALHNLQSLCPSIAPALINLYRNDTNLFVDGKIIKSQEGTTQGDPLAMAMFALGMSPLLKAMSRDRTKQIWYADDAAATGSLDDLKAWWDKINAEGPKYGYYPNSKKTWLIVNETQKNKAERIFKESGVSITTSGRPYLGAPIGTAAFKKEFIKEKVDTWKQELEKLSSISSSQPQSAYAAYTHSYINNLVYLIRTTKNIDGLLQPIEDVIRCHLLPAMTGRPPPTEEEREVFNLPTRFGGLGIINPAMISDQFEHSKLVTLPLVTALREQSTTLGDIPHKQRDLRNDLKLHKKENLEKKAKEIVENLSPELKRSVELASERGASTWLSSLPIADHGFKLHKGAFRDALCLRYGWSPRCLPSHCACGKSFTVEHVLSCPTGGFPIIRHNEVRDIMASFLTEVSHSVEIEPTLQPLTGESFPGRGTICEDLARADIAVNGFFGGRYERAFFDIRVCNPHARSYHALSLDNIFRRQEAEKRRKYERRVREVENSSFVPFVMSCTGGFAPTASIVIKRLASMTSEKTGTPHSRMMAWMRCRLSFAMVRSSLMCLRGARSRKNFPAKCGSAATAVVEARLSHED